jgi:hypothetical protein
LIHTYFSDRGTAGQKIQAIAKQISIMFAEPRVGGVDIQFVGVWDTVASVGMRPFKAKFTAPPTIPGKHFLNVRQALALDEHRAQFKPRLYANDNGMYKSSTGSPATLVQQWFRGSHCDVGGGYKAGETSISDEALVWLALEAVGCGLRLFASGSQLLTSQALANARHVSAPGHSTPRVHSQLYGTPLWALTGLAVRQTDAVDLDDSSPPLAVKPVEHASVATDTKFPQNTVWAIGRPKTTLLLCLLAVVVLLIAQGEALSPTGLDFSWDLASYANRVWTNLGLAGASAWAQLTWTLYPVKSIALTQQGAPFWALFWDTAMIPLYAYVACWLAVVGFARWAGLHRVEVEPSRFLNILGWAVPLLVFSDLLENLATLLVLWALSQGNMAWAGIAGLAMSALSLAKLSGLVGVIVLSLAPRKR